VRNGRIHQQTEKVSAKLTASSAVCKNSYEVLLKKSNAEERCRRRRKTIRHSANRDEHRYKRTDCSNQAMLQKSEGALHIARISPLLLYQNAYFET
jgi:hypothetical protein